MNVYNPALSPYGSPYGLSVGQMDRTEELNNRISQRIISDVDMQPNFDPRPISTKYSLLPVVDSYARSTEAFKPYLDYHSEIMFYPGDRKAPVNGILNKIDLESDLRNQNYLLEKYDLGNKYIPSLESDLYKVQVKSSDNNAAMRAHPLLFSPFLVESSVDRMEPSYRDAVGQASWYNHTRTQLRGIS